MRRLSIEAEYFTVAAAFTVECSSGRQHRNRNRRNEDHQLTHRFLQGSASDRPPAIATPGSTIACLNGEDLK